MQLSVLNLAPVRSGQSYADAVRSMVALARYVEGLGVARYWIAEHHNMRNLASSATALLIQQVLAQTTTLRVGAGGVMLPNHSPYTVAEQYGTLETLYPGRVDLGLGRAPGTDQQTAYAIRRGRQADSFAGEIAELSGYFAGTNPVSAWPGQGLRLPFYILGSSTDSAYLAADLGLPYAFAAHFAPQMLEEAVAVYRARFQARGALQRPYVILGANAVVADDGVQARHLAATQTLFFLNVVTNAQQDLQPPPTDGAPLWEMRAKIHDKVHFGPVDVAQIVAQERSIVEQMTACTLLGSPKEVAAQLADLRRRAPCEELMAVSYIFDEAAQRHSYRLLKAVTDASE